MLRRSFIAVALVSLCAAGPAFAGGFNIYEMGARATALGGAFTATADDGSAIFYNPAGLAYQPEGWQFSVNVSPINPNNAYSRADGTTAILYPGDATGETKSNWFFPTGAYASYRSGAWSGGFGFFTPFGLGVEWKDPDNFPGRPLSTNAQIQGFYLSPVVTYQPADMVAISVGAHFVKTHLTLDRILTANLGTGTDVLNVADVEISGTSKWHTAFAAGLMVKPTTQLTLGANYKQGLTNEFRDQDATFTQRSTGSAALDASVTANLEATVGRLGTQNVSGDLDYPDILALGARYDFDERFALEVDGVWFGWSAFKEVKLDFELAPTAVLEEDYQDKWQIRVGGQYTYSPQWRFMLGYVRDDTPQPKGSMSPLLPDATRNDFSGGVTWTTANGRHDVTLGYMLVEFEERDTLDGGVGQNYDGFDAAYKSRAHIFTLAFNGRF